MLETTVGQKNLPRYFAQVFEMTKKMNTGRLDFELPDGRIFRAHGKNPGPVSHLKINNSDVFARLIREGDLGFCDAYLDGWWSTPDLQIFLDLMHADNDEMYDAFPGMGMVRAWEKFRFWLQSNSKTQARKNISYHYDLGNDFYKLWLDETMTYSSAIFKTGQESTESAQIEKYSSLINQMGAKEGDHVLEIGCGWGGFAEYAAKERGLKVTGLTISKEQLKYAENRIKEQRLAGHAAHSSPRLRRRKIHLHVSKKQSAKPGSLAPPRLSNAENTPILRFGPTASLNRQYPIGRLKRLNPIL